jgi:hypothetical protein
MARELVADRESQRVLECGRLRLRFVWRGDRFAHEVSLVGQQQTDSRLRSVEGADGEAWPASPPLQSLHVEEQAGKQVALLVGMAGKCHWSAAVELDAGHSRLRWDVACRVRGGEPRWLGSSYQSDAKMRSINARRATVGDSGGEGHLVVYLEDGTDSAAKVTVEDRGLSIDANQNIASAGAVTIRWSYVIEPIV